MFVRLLWMDCCSWIQGVGRQSMCTAAPRNNIYHTFLCVFHKQSWFMSMTMAMGKLSLLYNEVSCITQQSKSLCDKTTVQTNEQSSKSSSSGRQTLSENLLVLHWSWIRTGISVTQCHHSRQLSRMPQHWKRSMNPCCCSVCYIIHAFN